MTTAAACRTMPTTLSRVRTGVDRSRSRIARPTIILATSPTTTDDQRTDPDNHPGRRGVDPGDQPRGHEDARDGP